MPNVTEVVEEELDLDQILEDMDLDPSKMNLDELRRQEQEETDTLEAFVRSQLNDSNDGVSRHPSKRARHDSEYGRKRRGRCFPTSGRDISTQQFVQEAADLEFLEEGDNFLVNEDDLFNNLAQTSPLNTTETNHVGDVVISDDCLPEATPPPLGEIIE